MITQRELDIAQLEAKQKSDKLFEEWHAAYLGARAGVQNGGGQRGRSGAEDRQAPEAEDNESVGVGAEGGAVLPAVGY